MEEQGTCINFIASTFANGFVNIVVDTVMVIMPVYEVSRLNLSVQKKIGVAVMLGMGLVYVFPSFVPCFGIHAYTYLQIDDHWNRPRRHFLPKHLQHKPNLCVSSKYPPLSTPINKSRSRNGAPKPLVRDRMPNRHHLRLPPYQPRPLRPRPPRRKHNP